MHIQETTLTTRNKDPTCSLPSPRMNVVLGGLEKRHMNLVHYVHYIINVEFNRFFKNLYQLKPQFSTCITIRSTIMLIWWALPIAILPCGVRLISAERDIEKLKKMDWWVHRYWQDAWVKRPSLIMRFLEEIRWKLQQTATKCWKVLTKSLNRLTGRPQILTADAFCNRAQRSWIYQDQRISFKRSRFYLLMLTACILTLFQFCRRSSQAFQRFHSSALLPPHLTTPKSRLNQAE